MPMALTDVIVTVKQNNGTETHNIDAGGTELTWQHNQLWHLDISANFGGVTDGQVKITVAPGLRIVSHYDGATGSIDKFEISFTHKDELPNYTFPQTYDTVTYWVSSGAGQVSLDLTLAVDTVLWPKTNGWKIENAITVDITGTEDSQTRTATVTVDQAENETSASWNRLYSSDSNDSVPAVTGKDFRLRSLIVTPNLHNTSLGMYYPRLKLTVPWPQVQKTEGGGAFARYTRVEASVAPQETSSDEAAHTVTFTWENLYIKAGSTLTVTPYFQWDAAQTEGDTVKFSDFSKFKVDVEEHRSTSVVFTTEFADSVFTVRGDVYVAFKDGGSRDIFNYGSTSQVYQLGQFLVRNNGFGDGGTGPLTLTFTYPSDTAHVTAQRIPLKAGGEVTNITYTTNSGVGTAAIEEKYYSRGSYQSYLLLAPSGQYFTSITATVDGYGPLYVGYNNSASLSPSNGCVTYGVMAAENTTGDFTAKLSISSVSGVFSSPVEHSYTSTITTTASSKATTQMKVDPGSPLFSFKGSATNKAQLGTDEDARTVGFSAYISATEYPYTNNQVVDRPVIYIRLPQTIKVDTGSIKLYTSTTDFSGAAGPDGPVGNSHYTITAPVEKEGEDFHVYKIEFNTGDYAGAVGWFNASLGQTRLRLDFNMVADVDVHDVTLQMYDTIFVGYADDSPIKDSGSLSANQRADSHDVDGDGDTDERFSTMADNTAYQLELDAPRIGLDFNSYAKLSHEGESSYSNYKVPTNNVESLDAAGHIMYLTGETLADENAGIDFRFTAKNTTGESIAIDSDTLGSEDFYYYITVPKKGDNWDSHIQDAPFGLSLTIDGPVTVTETGESGLVEVLYSYSVNADSPTGDSAHYNNAATVKDYYKSWSEVESEKDKIRMIRISVKQDLGDKKSTGFPKGYEATFTIHYKFVEADKNELVGQFIEFGPCGMTTYQRNGSGDTGHTPTQRIRAEIQTGVIAGRVFIDEDFDGVYDGGEEIAYDTSGLTISAVHKEGEDEELDPEKTVHPAKAAGGDNTYEITGLQARTYTVTVTNNKYSGDTPSDGSLSFIQLRTADGNRVDSTYATGLLRETSFDVTIEPNADSVAQNKMMDIGLQRPHKVTFQVVYEDPHADHASTKPTTPDPVTVYVWHNTTINGSHVEIPTFTLETDFQWENGSLQWTNGKTTLDADITPITEDVIYTATAVRIPHNVTYNANQPDGYTVTDVPTGSQTAVNGETVQLKCVGSDGTAKPTASGSPSVVFMGWSETTPDGGKIYRKDDRETVAPMLKTELIMDGDGLIVYALWGYDTNGNHIADALETLYTVTYDAGEGENAPAQMTDLLENDTFELDDGADMTPPAGKDGKTVLFAGWMENSAPEKICAKGETPGGVVHPAGSEYTVKGNMDLYALWAYDENGNGEADYQETMYALNYDDNGVTDHPFGYPEDPDTYLPGTTVKLWQPEGTWTGTKSGKKVIFAGWSETPLDPVSHPAPDGIVEEIEMPSEGEKTVYAVWALDENDNGKLDYSETWYKLSYDKNSGDGPDEVPPGVDFLPGTRVPIATGIQWTRLSGREKPAVFIGWSLVQATDVFGQDGKAKVGGEEVDLTKDYSFLVRNPYDTTGVSNNITLYAVYAEDDDGDGNADYLEEAWPVYYYANGGEAKASEVVVRDNGLFRVCGHHHVAGEKNVALVTVDEGKTLIQRKDAVLIGWSKTKDPAIVDSPETYETAQVITTVDIPDEAADGKQYVEVYAVWAADLNGNGTADYTEKRLSQWYFYNKALKDWRPAEPFEKTEANVVDTAMPADVDDVKFPEGVSLPTETGSILPDTMVNVPDATLKERTDYDDKGSELHHYIQLGWSAASHSAVTNAADADSWLLGKEGTDRKVSGPADQYNFAVWAPDDNHNNIADYNDPKYTLNFVLKGGSNGPDNRRDVLEGVTVALSPEPTKEQALFLGWSEEDLCAAGNLRAAPAAELLRGSWIMPGKNVTLYAVWAADRDKNGTADYAQTVTVTYVDNPQLEGSVSGMPEPREVSVTFSDQDYILSGLTPTHTQADGQEIVFIAWSTDRTSGVYGPYDRRQLNSDAPADTRYAPGSTLHLPADAGDVTLYAVWGYDANGMNGPDVLEPLYTLNYDANGGFHAPNPRHGLLEGDRVELSGDATYEAGRDDVILAGWTTPENIIEDILTWDNAHDRMSELEGLLLESYTMGAGDAAVYAVWAEDLNGNGTPNYREDKNILTYHFDGAEQPADLTQGGEHLPDTRVPLWRDAGAGTDEAWSKGAGSGKSVFVGWTRDREKAAGVLTEAPSREDLARRVLMTGDVDVYALWARDRNGNGIPDYDDIKITLTLDPNGGMEGTAAAPDLYLTDLLPGTYTGLASGKAAGWTKTVDGQLLVFAGWSLEPLDGYIDAVGVYQDKNRGAGDPAEEILLSDPYQVPEANRTLYAVYAAGEKSGSPDYRVNAVNVEYYANGGTSTSEKWLNGTEGLFYICPHSHAPGETETALLTAEQGNAYIFRARAVLLGWSAQPAELCATKAQAAAVTLAETAALPAAGHGNAKLYAVWAADADENGIPDYLETDPGPAGDLAVSVTVEGSKGETDRVWHFRVEVSDDTLSGLYGDMLFVDGAAEFTLRHGQTATATELPAGLTYTVTEREAGQDGYTTQSTGAAGAVPEGAAAQVRFVNSRDAQPAKTGDDTHFGFWLGLTLLAAVGCMATGTLYAHLNRRRYAGRHVRR